MTEFDISDARNWLLEGKFAASEKNLGGPKGKGYVAGFVSYKDAGREGLGGHNFVDTGARGKGRKGVSALLGSDGTGYGGEGRPPLPSIHSAKFI